ncbi:molybdopterin-guanine dinucleotide biosynthesis protein B [Eggerthellaceae bacterium zg-893]|nr:molybdopterin-guanine dinucleotide biosynthesis protein B [Eggerthellaceae bacterium zg-893]
MIQKPSPAVAVVGRHNSGKTTLVERVIAELTARGHDIGSVKHHGHKGFDIDYPGKDSYRHRAAGASETVIVSPDKMARVKTLEHDLECSQIVASMPNHDLVVVEGYRKSGLPTIEIMRQANAADARVAEVFAQAAEQGLPLGFDFVQQARAEQRGEAAALGACDVREDGATAPAVPGAGLSAGGEADAAAAQQAPDPHPDLVEKLPTQRTVALVTDIPRAQRAAETYGLPCFDPDDIDAISDFLEAGYVRPRLSVVIQAGGESRRMGRSKATVPFGGRPLMAHMVERMLPVADELVITTNEPENLGFLAEEFPEADIRLVRDALPTRGALPGFLTGLSAASCPIVAMVACDMVNASSALSVAEAQKLIETGADAVVPVNMHGFEPFHGVYRRKECLAAVQSALDSGETKVQHFIRRVRMAPFTRDEVLEVEPRGGCFLNANTPDELATLERSLLA